MAKFRDVEVELFRRRPNSDEYYSFKSTYTIVFDEFHDGSPVRPEEEQVESFIQKTYGWNKGVQYDHFKINTIKNHETNNNMAKKKQEIEEAQIIEETKTELVVNEEVETVEATEEKDTTYEAKLPAIPSVFIVNGNEHSLAAVSKLEKEANDLIKLATPETYEDKELWDKIDRKRLDARDQRTKLEAQRKKLVKPINDKLSELKATTDEIGAAAKEVEDKLQEVISKKQNWEEEQAEIERQRIAKRTKEREEKLRNLGGKFDFDALAFSFEHNPGLFINTEQLNEMSDTEFEAELKLAEETYQEELARQAKEKEDAEKALKEANEAKERADKASKDLIDLRVMLLGGNGYQEDEGYFHKNGHTISPEQIAELSNEDFIKLTVEHNTPKEEVAEFDPNESPMEPVDLPVDIDLPEIPVVNNSVSAESKKEEQIDFSKNMKFISLKFTDDEPYIDMQMGKSILRITHIDFEDASLQNVNAEQDILAKQIKGDMVLMAIGQKKK